MSAHGCPRVPVGAMALPLRKPSAPAMHHTTNNNPRAHQHPEPQPAQPHIMSSTSEAVADSIASQYAAAMDNLIDDAARVESRIPLWNSGCLLRTFVACSAV